MDYPALIAALPADLVLAVAGTPQGLDSTDHVYVSDERRAKTEDVEAWWLLTGTEILSETLGNSINSYTFTLELSKLAGTRAEMEVWVEQVRQYYHGHKKPASITGHLSTSVADQDMDLHEGEDGVVACTMEISFVGVDL